MAGITIKIDRGAVAGLMDAADRAAVRAVDALKTDVVSAQVMPFDTGDMQNNQTFVETQQEKDSFTARLETGAPQARRLYFHPEYNFQRVNNANAGGEWWAPWLTGEKKSFLPETYAKMLKREAKL